VQQHTLRKDYLCKAKEIDIAQYAQLSVLGLPQELLPEPRKAASKDKGSKKNT
jgi:hypothetical protein